MGAIIVPEEGVRGHELTAIPGTPPNLKNPPAGCRFADRCKYVVPACRVHEIPMLCLGGDRCYRCGHSESTLREAYAHERK